MVGNVVASAWLLLVGFFLFLRTFQSINSPGSINQSIRNCRTSPNAPLRSNIFNLTFHSSAPLFRFVSLFFRLFLLHVAIPLLCLSRCLLHISTPMHQIQSDAGERLAKKHKRFLQKIHLRKCFKDSEFLINFFSVSFSPFCLLFRVSSQRRWMMKV